MKLIRQLAVAVSVAVLCGSAMADLDGNAINSTPNQGDHTIQDPTKKYFGGLTNFYVLEGLNFSDTRMPIKDPEKRYFLSKSGGKWHLIDFSEYDLKNEDHESLAFVSSRDFQMNFTTPCDHLNAADNITKNTCACTRGLFNNVDRKKSGYSLCTSNFKKLDTSFEGISSMTIGAVLSPVVASTVVMNRLDENAIRSAIKESNLLELMNREYYENYIKNFNLINSPSSADDFLKKYSNYDPDNLIDKVILKRASFISLQDIKNQKSHFNSISTSDQAIRFVEIYQNNDLAGLMPNAKLLIEKLKKEEAIVLAAQRKQDALRQEAQRKEEAAKQAKLEAWRKSIKVGDDTFCGPVIEVRQPMVRISIKVPLSGYPSETWLKSSELYPDWMAGCRNVNGQIRPMF